LRQIQITNNLTNRKEALTPLEPGKIKMYACGITVYDHSHIGHAMQAIFFDVIRSYLEFAGYDVTYVRNYTDVDDKIINRAKERSMSPAQLAKEMIDSTDKDLSDMGVRPPHHAPCVSSHIPEIIAMIEQLVERKAAYKTSEGDVYYRVKSKADYGKLSNRKPDELRSGTRALVDGGKEDELDFALWKSDETPDASWPSPWGQGRPGWHIECSAMAKHYLGSTFDIHGGGRDLIFPHHENEIAQSESANGAKYVNYWTHCGLMTIDKQKMSKSLGNHILIQDFLRDWPAEVLRLSILEHHYTSNIDFSKNAFRQSLRRLLYYYRTLAELDQLADPAGQGDYKAEDALERFHQFMSDDFNTAAAIGDLNKEFKRGNDWLRGKKTAVTKANAFSLAKLLRQTFGVLGLMQEDPEAAIPKLKDAYLRDIGLAASDLQDLMGKRQTARESKDWPAADAIRDELNKFGIEVMDTPSGPDWTVTSLDLTSEPKQ